MTSVQDLVQLATAAGVILTAVASLRNGRGIKQVHDTVNSAATEQTHRVEQLAGTLTDAGLEVPPRREPPQP